MEPILYIDGQLLDFFSISNTRILEYDKTCRDMVSIPSVAANNEICNEGRALMFECGVNA